MPGSREPVASALVQAMADPAVVVDAAGDVVAWNGAAERDGTLRADGPGRERGGIATADHWAAATRVALADGGHLLAWTRETVVTAEAISAEKARILEHLAPGVAHDLINQVGGIRSFLSVIGGGDERDRQLLDDTAAKAVATVRSFQDLVRTRRSGPADIAPATVIAEALAVAAHPLAEVTVSAEVADDLPELHVEPADFRQALLAVLVNAMDAMGWPAARGSLRVLVRRTDAGIAIAVEDDAAAVPPSLRDWLFDLRPPTASGRAPLDLAVARHLARRAGGDVRLEAADGLGNRFVLELPAASVAAILVCDDDDAIRTLIVRVLQREGVDAVGAADGDAALALLAERPVSLVVADHHLGSLSGLDLYTRAVDLHPALRGRFVLVSGDAGDPALVAFAREHGLRVVEKPFDVTELARLVRDLAAG
jgi:signal transduction histidine kinase/CheY-like chemotaxis protein